MRPTIIHESKEDMPEEFKAVCLIQSPGLNSRRYPLPVPCQKQAFQSLIGVPGREQTKTAVALKDHIMSVIEIVHGSSLTRRQLNKEVREKVP